MIKKVNPVEIVVDENELGVRSDEIDVRKSNKELRQIIAELQATILDKNITALSAPEIGYQKRLFTINFNGELRTFINPIITQVKGFELSKETCESIKGTYIRPRHNDIFVTYQTPLGKIENKELIGAAAKVFQHQIDHLDGLLLPDIGMEIDEEFENATQEEQEEVIKFYLDTLEIKHNDIKKDIQEDKELKQLSDAVDFIEQVQKGEVQLGDKVSQFVPANDNGNNPDTD